KKTKTKKKIISPWATPRKRLEPSTRDVQKDTLPPDDIDIPVIC
ncbi:unnamed protein product, partial [Arabidopsis halleri]